MTIRNETRRKLILSAGVAAVAASLVGSSTATAAPKFWAGPDATTNETGLWDLSSTNWDTASSTTPSTTFATNDDATFDQAQTYTVTANTALTAASISFNAGNVTVDGTASVSSTGAVTVANGATLNLNSLERVSKAGATSFVINGTVNASAGTANTKLQTLSGTSTGLFKAGTTAGVSLRLQGTSVYNGNLSDFALNSGRFGLLGNAGTGFDLTLGGDNSAMSGDVLFGGATDILRLKSANALGSGSILRFEGTTAVSLVELGAGDLTRAYNATSTTTGNGGVNWVGTNAGFFATGADRNLTFVTIAGGSTAADVTFGVNGLASSTVVFGNTAATNKVTWTNNIGLTSATRTFAINDGAAAVEAELSGVISSTTTAGALTKSGAGTLLLSNSNTFTGPVSVSAGGLRLSNGQALGADATVKAVGVIGGATVGGVQLTGGITVNNKNLNLAGGTSTPSFGRLINVSGNNTWNGDITAASSGGGYALRSDAGTLTLGGNIYNNTGDVPVSPATTVTRGLVLYGAGDYAVTGLIRNRIATPTVNLTSLIVGTGAQANFSGSVTLSNANTYTGGTTVNSGRLITANTSALGAGGVTIGNSATPTIATLTVGDGTTNTVGGLTGLTINNGSTFETGGANSQIALNSGVFSLGNVVLDLNNLFNADGTYVLIDGIDGANAIGTVSFVDISRPASDYTFSVIGNDGVLTVAVPEPTSLALLGLGGLAMLRRRNRVA